MRTIVIGGTGHVGTYLVPRLVEAGHEVICVSRQQRDPYQPHAAWQLVQRVHLDRAAEERGTGVQAGWIKLSVGDNGITPIEAKIVRAAARAGAARAGAEMAGAPGGGPRLVRRRRRR